MATNWDYLGDLGMGLLANGGVSTTPRTFGQGLGNAALYAGQQQGVREDRNWTNLQRSMSLQEMARKQQEAEQRQQYLAQVEAQLPPEQRQAFRANPQPFLDAYTIKPGEKRMVGGMILADGGIDPEAQARTDKANKEAAKLTFDQEDKLRDEYISGSKKFVEVRDSYSRLRASQPTAAGDIALIFNYMKMLDPGSTVREGEFATASQAGGVDKTVLNLYNSILRGERLQPEQRAMFIDQAREIYDGTAQQHQAFVGHYSNLANQYQLDPAKVIVDYSAVEKKQEAAPLPKKNPTASDLKRGQRYKIKLKTGQEVEAVWDGFQFNTEG